MIQVKKGTESGLFRLLQQHLAWYPQMRVQDVYKLLYQGVLGPEHMVPTRQEFIRKLVAEFELLSPDKKCRLVEPIRADETLFRLNLRAYKSTNQSVVGLGSLFLDTLQLIEGTKAELVDAWQQFVTYCDQGKLDEFPLRDVSQFSLWLESEDFPAIHHSEAYRRHYLPSYRLISGRFVRSLGENNAV